MPPVPVVPPVADEPPVPVVPPVADEPPVPVVPPVAPPTQVPLLQLAPPLQTAQLEPQWPESVFELQAPSLHIVLPEPQPPDMHDPLLQTSPLAQAAQLDPQCWVLEATHEPAQRLYPVAQTQLPAWQMLPVSQVCPHPPQLLLSLWVSTQEPLQSV
jgi:hypothetical protein